MNSLFRFQNIDLPKTFLYVSEAEAESIRLNFPNFIEEGFAFSVDLEPNNNTEAVFRFQNENNLGTYLFAAETESQRIREEFSPPFKLVASHNGDKPANYLGFDDDKLYI